MPYCEKCGAEVEEGAKFCTECGNPLTEEAGRSTTREKKKAVTTQLDVEKLLSHPELVMGFGALLLLIGSFGTWVSTGFYEVGGWDVGGIGGPLPFFLSLLMFYSAARSMGYVKVLRKGLPAFATSAICGLSALVASVSFLSDLSSWGDGGWGIYLVLVGALVSIFAAILAYRK